MAVQETQDEGLFVRQPRDEKRLQQHIADLEVKRSQLKVLNEFAISLMTIGSIESLLWHVARQVVAKLGFVDCVIYQLQAHDNQLVQTAASGDKDGSAQHITNQLIIPVGSGITGTVAETGGPLIIGDVAQDPRFIRDIATSRSEICVPLIVNGELYGVIDCEDPGVSAFDENHLEILTTVASMTASKIAQCLMMERQLHQSEIIQRVSEMVIVATREGRILDCNPATERVYDTSREDLIGLNIFDLNVTRSEEQSLRPDAIKALREGMNWSSRIAIDDKDNIRRHFEVSFTPITGPNGAVSRFVTVGREVTRQVEAEISLKERNQVLQDMGFELRDALEQSRIGQRTQAAFLANVSHELRTPLNAIVGFSDIVLQTDVLQRAPEKVMEYNQYIHSAGTHLTSLVNDILDISSLAADESEAAQDHIRVAAALDACKTLIKHKADAKMISIDLTACADTPDIIFDDRHFQQIFTNLLDNAIKFSPEQSTVSLGTSRDENDELYIWIKDEGRGIKEAQLESIFTAFSRADWVRSQKVEGAGLGLALVNEMVSSNGCEISVESQLGKGTTFALHIPTDHIVRESKSAS